jgi:hypothetical protein
MPAWSGPRCFWILLFVVGCLLLWNYQEQETWVCIFLFNGTGVQYTFNLKNLYDVAPVFWSMIKSISTPSSTVPLVPLSPGCSLRATLPSGSLPGLLLQSSWMSLAQMADRLGIPAPRSSQTIWVDFPAATSRTQVPGENRLIGSDWRSWNTIWAPEKNFVQMPSAVLGLRCCAAPLAWNLKSPWETGDSRREAQRVLRGDLETLVRMEDDSRVWAFCTGHFRMCFILKHLWK